MPSPPFFIISIKRTAIINRKANPANYDRVDVLNVAASLSRIRDTFAVIIN